MNILNSIHHQMSPFLRDIRLPTIGEQNQRIALVVGCALVALATCYFVCKKSLFSIFASEKKEKKQFCQPIIKEVLPLQQQASPSQLHDLSSNKFQSIVKTPPPVKRETKTPKEEKKESFFSTPVRGALTGKELTIENIQALSRDLESLSLSRCNLENAITLFPHLPPNLKSIDLGGCKNGSADIFAYLPSTIEHLNLRGWIDLTDDDIKKLQRFPGLRSLNITGCLGLTDKIAEYLPSSIGKIVAKRCMISSKVIKAFSENLEFLDLSECLMVYSLADLNCPNLKTLKLAGCNALVNEIPALVTRLIYLEYLDLSSCSDLLDAHIEDMPDHVKKLVLDGCLKLTEKSTKIRDRFSIDKRSLAATPFRPSRP